MGSNAACRVFWFLESQAAIGTILTLFVVVTAQNSNLGLRIQDLIDLATLVAAMIGEAIADRQLRGFKRYPASRNAVATLVCGDCHGIPSARCLIRIGHERRWHRPLASANIPVL